MHSVYCQAVTRSVFDALSIGGGLVAAVLACVELHVCKVGASILMKEKTDML